MARPLDLRQQQELTDFVNALYAAAGYTTIAEWSRDSDYPAPNLSNLRNGNAGIDGYNLLRLIRAASARVESTPAELAASLERVKVEGSAESIDSRLRELSDLVQLALELLEELRAPQGAPQTPAIQRKGRTKAQ